jgi:hypothetical protein
MTIHIIAAFPATGKSYFAEQYPDDVVDLDSSGFSKDPAFPTNYIDAIAEQVETGKIVLVSTHSYLLLALQDRGWDHILAFPEQTCKAEYIERMQKRLSPQSLIDTVANQWDAWIPELFYYPRASPMVMGEGMYLTDLFYIEDNRIKFKD